jgi:hypothetical protein
MCSIYALRALLTALSPLIGAELSRKNKAVSAGWADGAKATTITQWKIDGVEEVKEEMERVATEVCSSEYGRLMRKVCGFWIHTLTSVSNTEL